MRMRVNEARQNHHITGVHVPLEAHRLRLSAQPLLHVSGSANGRDLASLVHDKRRVLEHSQLLLGRAGLERLTIRADLNDLASVGNTESERAHGVDGRTRQKCKCASNRLHHGHVPICKDVEADLSNQRFLILF
ncbi:hypothetical protein L917_03883 [Phytophthora nicotianae]|uniref:Uncharacterized protein n=1 Tax=Phytophthora nicotianae TaxID=4792 RepID=W2LNY7_PHYNI|nr:hypothetical protein L917_03883 [Phytophthora nicotianae]